VEPLRKLTQKGVQFEWTLEQQEAFEALQNVLISSKVMAYYRPKAKTNIVVDTSPYGLGAILNQQQSNGEYRPVAYASKTLTDVQ